MRERIYINDFCEDLNYAGVILYVGSVNISNLRKALEQSDVNKIYRLDYALNKADPAQKNFIYVENCDLQDLSWPVHEYMEDKYDIYVLYEDLPTGMFYIKKKLLGAEKNGHSRIR